MKVTGDFAIFITTHGRAGEQVTLNTLRACNCSYPIYLVVDNEDGQLGDYEDLYGDMVIVFDKREYMDATDTIISPKRPQSVVFARQFCERVARESNLSCFLVLDDDIKSIEHRFIEDGRFRCRKITDIDAVLGAYASFILDNGIACAGFGNGASYIGSSDAIKGKNLKRRCFNTFLRNTSIPVDWISNMNEDYATSIQEGKVEKLFLEVADIGIVAKDTGKAVNNGGMLDLYRSMNPFERAFICTVSNPSCLGVGMNRKHSCIIKCRWDSAVPKIISHTYRKSV